MIINSAVILAGGFGTRLQTVVKDLPKPMAPINGRPFLEYILDYLMSYNVTEVVLSIGYMHNHISDYFGNNYKNVINISYAVEDTPLGTGGAIKRASTFIKDNYFFVLNGDSLFDIDLIGFSDFFLKHNAEIALSLRKMTDVSRYGNVTVTDNIVTSFQEKGVKSGEGLINGGVYLMKKSLLCNYPDVFSFEKDFLEKTSKTVFAQDFDAKFIDIGVPDDYYRAPQILTDELDDVPTLFLDRDGVINKRIVGGYVTKPDEFVFEYGAKEAIAFLTGCFRHIIIISNQQGIKKGVMTAADVDAVHSYMCREIEKVGGKIDGIYYCPDLASENSPRRKPATGMGYNAKKDFPDIVFANSIMVGDAITDIEFGKRLNMTVVLINHDGNSDDSADFNYTSLATFAKEAKDDINKFKKKRL